MRRRYMAGDEWRDLLHAAQAVDTSVKQRKTKSTIRRDRASNNNSQLSTHRTIREVQTKPRKTVRERTGQ